MNPATGAWIGLIILLSGYILGFDLWAEKTGHQTMSGQIHIWMQQQLTGPIVVGLWFGIGTALMYHFLINRLCLSLNGGNIFIPLLAEGGQQDR